MRRSSAPLFKAALVAGLALFGSTIGCNAIFGVNDFVVVENGGGGTGGSGGSGAMGGTGGSGATGGTGGATTTTSQSTGGGPCDGQCAADSCCNGMCVNLEDDPVHCGQCDKACSKGVEACCGGTCTDIALDEANCGACGKVCPGTVCFGGECSTTCQSPFQDCNQNIALDGCEADLTSDTENCGTCGIACPQGATCNGGLCACADGFEDCDGNPVNGCETAIDSDALNCGGCGESCGANQVCTFGVCTCIPTFDDCNNDPNDGCEINLSNMSNCGACDTACGPNMECVGGMCQCTVGFLDCTGAPGCESSATSAMSCGMCDMMCTGMDVCTGMGCLADCLGGQTLCGSSCVDVMTDPQNCGACDMIVEANQTCSAGVPTCNPEYADCTVDPGCETKITNDPQNCGGCGVVCKPGALCVQGACFCAATTPKDCGADCRRCCSDADCSDGQGCTTDTCAPDGLSCSNAPCAAGTQCCSQIACAACCSDMDCAQGQTCSGGICSTPCPPGKTLCGGQCVDTQTNPNHCNGCNIKCGSDGTCACSAGACSGGTIYFSEDFSDNFKGWTLGPEWAIGPTVQSSGEEAGNPDPAMDHSATSDNGVAGVVIGGNYGIIPHAYYQLTSPTIDLSSASGAVKLTFFRWLNGGATTGTKKVIHRVEITTGATYFVLWQDDTEITDSAWTKQEIDVTGYKSATVKIRFSYSTQGGSGSILSMSGFNIDDVTLSSGVCN